MKTPRQSKHPEARRPAAASQPKSAAHPTAQRGGEPLIDNSPRMVAQRKRLNHLFGAAQMKGGPEEEMLQGKFGEGAAPGQNKEAPDASRNRTGLPGRMKAGIENLSGISLNDVRVHYNSSEPAQLQALAYTQGTDIHVGPGQEQHLAHEAWHVVQQKQGRVKPTMQMKGGVNINDDDGLEREADVMGEKALLTRPPEAAPFEQPIQLAGSFGTLQLKGVGGSKIAFEKRLDPPRQQVIEEGLALLKAAWKEARALRKGEKQRIGKDMADYDKAVKDGDQPTINRLEAENDRRNRPQLYQAKDLAGQALKNHLDQINALKSQLFHDNESMAIFGQQYRLEDLGNAPPVGNQNRLIGQAIGRIMRDPQIIALNQQAVILKGQKDLADTNLEQDIQNHPKSGGLTQVYFDSLSSQIPNEEVLLQRTTTFQSGALSVLNNEITYHHHAGDLVIADLRQGLGAYASSRDQPALNQARQVYHKKGLEDLTTGDGSRKEYVKDTRGAMTRRYAYVEKNYYQMMEFFMVGHMTGRFQQYMLAGAERKPGVHKFTTKMIKNVPQTQPNTQTRMTDTQVAVAHQMYGSLPEQRGVSLTATPKVGVTYANTSGNFRTDEGFKLKIDLARVPEEVLFLNHYAEGGVSDTNLPDYSTQQSHKPNPYNYKYKESATHARELFLEHIRPEWVVEIEHHAKGGFQNIQGQKTIIGEGSVENLLEAAKRAFGGQEYEKGFEVGLNNGQDVSTLVSNPDYKKGKGTGKMIKDGYQKGLQVRKQKGHSNDLVAFKEIMEDPAIQDEMSPFHIGYAQARTGQPMVSSVLEFRTLLNTEMEFKNAKEIGGGTTALAHDADKVIIKSTLSLQTGGFRSKIVTIPFEELRTAAIEYEVDGDNIEITIKKSSGDYTLVLPKAEAMSFIGSLQKYVDQNSRQQTIGDTAGGGSHTLILDTKNLRLERQYKNYLGVQKLNKSDIPLETIKKVVFEWDEQNIQVGIHHNGGVYEMNLNSAEAVKVRTLLLRNKLNTKIVGDIPDKI